MERDEEMIALMMKLVNHIGDCLIKIDNFKLAKTCFTSIANAYKVLEIFAKEYDKITKKNSPKEEKLKFLL